ncbi:uncharacterized protein [Venturia canescens]|uniref:uncharacterized protein n=1 Tax=Venturia canescens TaxID=32260 RepID=UPI001C9D307B|nr:uncharacterized protein LOC122406706 [Venturia canescens]
MEIDQNLIFNFASIIATFLLVSSACITIFRGLKSRWPIKVNCWFCNNYTQIYRSESHWWKCSSCEQYNGFTKDGDYAYNIPEQSTPIPTNFKMIHPEHHKNENQINAKSLCERCNKNEELKVFQLQNFEPKGFFNSGLKRFKQELELKYPLCDDCKILVQYVLQKQSLWLTRYKMLFYKQRSVKAMINNAARLEKIVRICLTLLTSITMRYSHFWPLPFVGAFLQSSTFLINQVYRGSDALLTLLWICISLTEQVPYIRLEVDKNNEWSFLENLTRRHFVTVLVLIIGIMNITSKYRNTRNFKASFKKLETPDKNRISFSTVDDSFEDSYLNEKTNKSQQMYLKNRDLRVDDGNSTFQKKSFNLSKSENRSINLSGKLGNDSSNDFSETRGRHVLEFDGNFEQYSLNESLSTLKTLTLGESRAEQTAKTPSIFRTKVYNSTSPDLFNRTKKSTRKFVLAPPKLKSFVQTSWVAGGYWQVGVDTPTLSRSSSQSSGFGSAGSNFGPSREPSVTKEIDKCSVMSENTQLFYLPRPNSANSMNSCCQHVSPLQFARCETLSYHQPQKIMPNSQSHFSPVHPETNTCYERCLSLQNGNSNFPTIQPRQQLPICHSILNNATWLTILLGGSFIFNVAVFCTVVLR